MFPSRSPPPSGLYLTKTEQSPGPGTTATRKASPTRRTKTAGGPDDRVRRSRPPGSSKGRRSKTSVRACDGTIPVFNKRSAARALIPRSPFRGYLHLEGDMGAAQSQAALWGLRKQGIQPDDPMAHPIRRRRWRSELAACLPASEVPYFTHARGRSPDTYHWPFDCCYQPDPLGVGGLFRTDQEEPSAAVQGAHRHRQSHPDVDRLFNRLQIGASRASASLKDDSKPEPGRVRRSTCRLHCDVSAAHQESVGVSATVGGPRRGSASNRKLKQESK